MVPRLTKGGQSFKGAALYYLHDKRLDGEKVRLTADRVSWSETRNLPTTDPQRAWRMMADTASQQAALKSAAGLEQTGRKLEKPVFAYSLSWHPEENPDRAEMLRAVDASLKALGLEHHQALITAHHDEPHPHVHILLNRVSPIDGRAATLSNSKLALSRWAEAYEKEQGKIRCDERVKNNAARDQMAEFNRNAGNDQPGIQLPKEANDDRKSGEARRKASDAARTNPRRAKALREEQLAKDRDLARRSSMIHAHHRQQWKDLQDSYKRQKASIAGQREAAVKAAIEDAKAARKGDWRAFFKDLRAQEREFWRNERSTLGKAWNTLQLATSTRVSRQGPESRGGLSRFFNLIVSRKGREEAFRTTQEDAKALRSEMHKLAIRHVAKLTRDSFKAEYQKGWTGFQQDRDALIVQQDFDRRAMKQAWADRRAEKTHAWQSFREEEGRLTERLGLAFGKAASRPMAPQEHKDGLSRTFDEASGRTGGRSQARGRERTRERLQGPNGTGDRPDRPC